MKSIDSPKNIVRLPGRRSNERFEIQKLIWKKLTREDLELLLA
jgi:hypothetical protein